MDREELDKKKDVKRIKVELEDKTIDEVNKIVKEKLIEQLDSHIERKYINIFLEKLMKWK